MSEVLGNWRHVGNGVARNTLKPEFYGCWQCCVDANKSGLSYASKMRSVGGVKDHIKLLHGGVTSGAKSNSAKALSGKHQNNSDEDSDDSDHVGVKNNSNNNNNIGKAPKAIVVSSSNNNNNALDEGNASYNLNRSSSIDGGGGASSVDSSDTDLSGESGDISGSGSSMSGLGAKKSTLPCGMNMVQMMLLLIGVPIIFLVVYCAIPLSAAVESQTFLSDHKSVIANILDIAATLQTERRDTAGLLSVGANSSLMAGYRDSVANFRAEAAETATRIIVAMQESKMEGRKAFLDQLQTLLESLSAERQKIDDRLVTGPEAMEYLILVVDQFFELLSFITRDSRGTPLHSRMILFLVLRRLMSTCGIIRGVGNSLILRDGFDNRNVQLVFSMRVSYGRDLSYAKKCGQPQVLEYINMWEKDPRALRFWNASDALENGNPTTWGNMSGAEWRDTSNDFVNLLSSYQYIPLNPITDGKILSHTALLEGMKMMAGVVACILATLIVIYYNTKEQARLERALDSTAVLAAAVQRFVPKNQLRTMGVRSITQVHPKMNTEVAQTVIFCSIARFSQLAESLENQDLYEWLSTFVERMTEVVQLEKSFVANFTGDGLMIISPQPTNGLAACVKIQVAVQKINVELVSEGSSQILAVGTGVATGLTVAGVFGDDSRLTCTFVSPVVSLASRLCKISHVFGCKILASQSIMDNISASLFAYRKVGSLNVFGKPTAIYDVFMTDALNVKEFKQSTKEKFEQAVAAEELGAAGTVGDELWDHLSFRASSSGVVDKAIQNRQEIRQILASLAEQNNFSAKEEHQKQLQKQHRIKRRSRTPQKTKMLSPKISKNNAKRDQQQQQNASASKNSNNNNNDSENDFEDGGVTNNISHSDSFKNNSNNNSKPAAANSLALGTQKGAVANETGMSAWRRAFKLK